MRIPGSLLGALIEDSTPPAEPDIAVVVIDEDATSSGAEELGGAASPPHNATARQQRVIALAQRFTRPIFLVQYSHTGQVAAGVSLGNTNFDATRTVLRGLLPFNTPIVTKHQPNAFQGTGFDDYLRQHHREVKRLLLMGWNSNACVAMTAGIWDAFATVNPGATHLGYTVMSCDDVLHGDPAIWADNGGQDCRERIKFYATL